MSGDLGLGTVFVARDVTEANNQRRRLAAAHAQLLRQVETIELLRADLAELASRDTLTGLHNRRHLVERIATMIAAAELTSGPLAVALFDVDRFKSINDDYGHLAGDAVLVELAQLMSEQAPVGALVARWGGEEFFVALPGSDTAAGVAFAEDLRRRCELSVIVVEGRMIRCTLSGGVAAYPASGTTMEDLFHAVDASMYEAKNAGRNLVRLHDPHTTIVIRHTGGRPLLGYAVQESNWRRLLGRPSRRGIDLTYFIASRAGLSVAPTRRLQNSGHSNRVGPKLSLLRMAFRRVLRFYHVHRLR